MHALPLPCCMPPCRTPPTRSPRTTATRCPRPTRRPRRRSKSRRSAKAAGLKATIANDKTTDNAKAKARKELEALETDEKFKVSQSLSVCLYLQSLTVFVIVLGNPIAIGSASPCPLQPLDFIHPTDSSAWSTCYLHAAGPRCRARWRRGPGDISTGVWAFPSPNDPHLSCCATKLN